ncbi:hypothetical protein BDA99DRAFT_108599 [Phascolomyces articulosus]|uniref:Uncharacterized protein n=1 Tax=Phascolomyces articulosus TaxID=60185 RepID=A0AAD5PCC9_9FUNG|nr:hypothetical protein BDA99DRAFT_108599 [Phascolomyces articulosus]
MSSQEKQQQLPPQQPLSQPPQRNDNVPCSLPPIREACAGTISFQQSKKTDFVVLPPLTPTPLTSINTTTQSQPPTDNSNNSVYSDDMNTKESLAEVYIKKKLGRVKLYGLLEFGRRTYIKGRFFLLLLSSCLYIHIHTTYILYLMWIIYKAVATCTFLCQEIEQLRRGWTELTIQDREANLDQLSKAAQGLLYALKQDTITTEDQSTSSLSMVHLLIP